MIDFGKAMVAKKNEYEGCEHLFIKPKEGVVKCLKCGLTNYHICMDESVRAKYDRIAKRANPMKYFTLIINDEAFKKQYGYDWLIKPEEEVFNLISSEIIKCDDPEFLYQEALNNNPDASKEELFNIMKELQKDMENKEDFGLKRKKRLD